MPGERIVAIGLLTNDDLNRLGGSLTRVWPVEKAPCFTELLQAIDAADAELAVSSDAARPLRPKAPGH